MVITSVRALRRAMRACEQTSGLSVLAHGVQVARYFRDLRQHVLYHATLRYEWKLPGWAYSAALWQQVLPTKTVQRYQIYHNCGKAFCKTVDEVGRVHFPDHARVSADIWRSLGQDSVEAELMSQDMAIHLLKDEGVDAFSRSPLAATLLLTGLAEIHANAAMFGGIESVSFKMKHKQLSRRGKAIVARLNVDQVNSKQESRYA